MTRARSLLLAVSLMAAVSLPATAAPPCARAPAQTPSSQAQAMSALPIPLTHAARSAVEQLARQLSVDTDEVVVVRMEEVDWPDGSVGCPKPGLSYRQVVVNGTFIQLRVGTQVYNFHGAGWRAPSLCVSKDEVLPEDLRRPPLAGDRRI